MNCLILQCVLSFIIRVSGLHLSVIPANIEPGTTTNLLVNCSSNIETTPPLVILNSLVLYISSDVNSSVHKILASINSTNGCVIVYDGDGVGSGSINNEGVSYLSIKWAFPFSDLAGQYICEANGMALSGHPRTSTTSVKVSSSQLNFNSMSHLLRLSKVENSLIIKEINQLTEGMKALKDIVTKSTEFIKVENSLIIKEINQLTEGMNTSTEFINKTKQETSLSLKTLFIESPPYNGRRYYLSRQSVLVTSTLAQATCVKHGGYLAEIDNEDELQFIRRFLNDQRSFTIVIFSGTDEGHEGYWVNSRNNTAQTYTRWYRTEPNGGVSENCICLWQAGDWYMGDFPCVNYNIDQLYRYLCEIVA